ncbi:ABC transporter permease [Granulicoccus sp. GXG6511]|uniref:ABC transporter permease n=1 Tax=Granulicoccus sp. GXG6511 TaxID=3381351 RepID=UPI003D7D961F
MTERSVSDVAPEGTVPTGGEPTSEKARSLGSDAWEKLRRQPIFWISSVLIVIMVTMAIAPQLFTFWSPSPDPYVADQSRIREAPGPTAWFGRDGQGFDVYSRTIYGARASILVGTLATVAVLLIGGIVGIFAGFYGKVVDAILSRIGDIFFAIPLLLGGILILYTFPSDYTTPYLLVVGKVVIALGILGWPRIARIMRASVLQVKPQDYVQAARALGASPGRIISGHVLPNAFAPVIVVGTIDLGVFIAVEATLSFLGIGLQPPTVSWGVMISDASALGMLRAAPHMLLFPSLFLSVTVLAFIMLGDAVRDAFDPKSR